MRREYTPFYLLLTGLLISLAINALSYVKGRQDGITEGRRLVNVDFKYELDRLNITGGK